MAAQTKFFPSFHRQLFGRPPVGKRRLLERKAREADQLCLTQLHTLFEDVLPASLAAYKAAEGTNSRHRIYTPLVTFWAFLSQTLDADGSCRRAVTRVQTLCSALGLPLPDEDTGAYCTARARLPMRLLLRVHGHVVETLGALPREGRRVLVMDGTSLRMPDSKENAAAYAHGPQQKPGCGFPLMPVLGLFDLSGGTWIAAVKSKPRAHDSCGACSNICAAATFSLLTAPSAPKPSSPPARRVGSMWSCACIRHATRRWRRDAASETTTGTSPGVGRCKR